jgi:hypothetical protein
MQGADAVTHPLRAAGWNRLPNRLFLAPVSGTGVCRHAAPQRLFMETREACIFPFLVVTIGRSFFCTLTRAAKGCGGISSPMGQVAPGKGVTVIPALSKMKVGLYS